MRASVGVTRLSLRLCLRFFFLFSVFFLFFFFFLFGDNRTSPRLQSERFRELCKNNTRAISLDITSQTSGGLCNKCAIRIRGFATKLRRTDKKNISLAVAAEAEIL